jgi:hypothetical protein
VTFSGVSIAQPSIRSKSSIFKLAVGVGGTELLCGKDKMCLDSMGLIIEAEMDQDEGMRKEDGDKLTSEP